MSEKTPTDSGDSRESQNKDIGEKYKDQSRFEIKSLWILYILPIVILVINSNSTKVLFLLLFHIDVILHSDTLFHIVNYILYFL